MAGRHALTPVPLRPFPLQRFGKVLPRAEFRNLMTRSVEARKNLRGRVIWNVNSTARGGGVAEMLRPLLSYALGVGVDARWLVLGGDADFFRVTKRVHNRLHGARGDGRPLGKAAHRAYDRAAAAAAAALRRRVRPGDVVILHDPQTAGLARHLRGCGATVVWRCHVGIDRPNELAREAIGFLLPYLSEVDAFIFSRPEYVWEGVDPRRTLIIAPSIDAFSPKNEPLEDRTVRAILVASRILAGKSGAAPRFTRTDGRLGKVRTHARMTEVKPLRPEDPVVLQVSRWDALKDPAGVIRGFARHGGATGGAHLVVAGPITGKVSDDPEDAAVLAATVKVWRALPDPLRRRVHLAELPMRDVEENAAIVNALQRHATVVVQKSLAEGFGLTVAEAMWKGRPVVASRVGGIVDQVVDGETGLLVEPRDLESFGAALRTLLADPQRAARMGEEAQRRVRDEFLAPRHLLQYLDLLEALLGHTRPA